MNTEQTQPRTGTPLEVQTSANAPWKQRFRAPFIGNTQIAAHNPEQGLVAGTQTGTVQWYTWDVPSGTLHQITDRPGGMAPWLCLSPDGQSVYYHDDKGVGNEIGHYVRIPYQGGEPVDITPDLPPYSSFYFNISHSGKCCGMMAADSEGFHIHVLELNNNGEPVDRREIFHSAQICFGPLLTSDGSLAVVMSSDRSKKPEYGLLAYKTSLAFKTSQASNMGNEQTTPVSQSEIPAELWDGENTSIEMKAASPVSGDQRILATTNRTGIETLLIWDPSSGERTDLKFEGATGSITSAEWSPDGKRIIFSVFHQAVQQLYQHDLEKNKTIPLQAPPGTHGNTYFTPDGKAIISIWEDSTHPPQVIALDPHTGQQTKILLKAGEVPPGQAWRWVNFASSDGQIIQGWLGVPPGKGPFPAILETHGGPESATPNYYSPFAQAWLDHGFAYLTINYRGSTTFGREFQEKIWGNPGEWEVEDMVAAREWLVKMGTADPDKILLTGWSYGGYLTLQALGKYPDLWMGGMAGIAIADWAVQYEDSADTLRGYEKAIFAGTPEEKPEQYAKSSPITYAENVRAPVLIIQGRNDTRTPARPVEMYESKMKALGKEIEVIWFDTGHAGTGADMEQLIRFQEEMLKFASKVMQKG